MVVSMARLFLKLLKIENALPVYCVVEIEPENPPSSTKKPQK